jgi:hypothetical protein
LLVQGYFESLEQPAKQITGYIFSRAQKGFTSGRYIQEVLMIVIEIIAHCNKNGIPGAILSIDQAKAFDSVGRRGAPSFDFPL